MSKGKKIGIGIILVVFILGAVISGVYYFVLNRDCEVKGKEGIEYKKEFNQVIEGIKKQIVKSEDYDAGIKDVTSNVYSIFYNEKGNILAIANRMESGSGDVLVEQTQYFVNGEFRYFEYNYDAIPEPDACMFVIGEVKNGKIIKYYVEYTNKNSDKETEKFRKEYFKENIKKDIVSFLGKIEEIKKKGKLITDNESEEESEEEENAEVEENVSQNIDIDSDGEEEKIEAKKFKDGGVEIDIYKSNGDKVLEEFMKESWYNIRLSCAVLEGKGLILITSDNIGSMGGEDYFFYELKEGKLKSIELPSGYVEYIEDDTQYTVSADIIKSKLVFPFSDEDMACIKEMKEENTGNNFEFSTLVYYKLENNQMFEELEIMYGTCTADRNSFENVILKYSYNNGWKLEDMYEGSLKKEEDKNMEGN